MHKIQRITILMLVGVFMLAGCTPQITSTPIDSITKAPLSTTPTPTQPEAATNTPAAAPSAQILAKLSGLDIDAFFEESYKQWLLRDPEAVTELGLARVYGVPNDRLTDISDAYIRDTQALESGILELLKKYDRASLSPEQQLSYDIYAWWLDDRVRGHEFIDDDYPLSPMAYSVHLELLQWFTDLRPVTDKQDVQDYIACLTQMKTKFAQLSDGLQRREAKGVNLPRFLFPSVISDLASIAGAPARSTPYYTALKQKMDALSSITPADKQVLLDSAAQAIDETVIPAYKSLLETAQHLQTVASDDAGVWKFPDGKAYYAYLLRHQTTTDMTADEIHELGLKEIESAHKEMRIIFDKLGYPKDASLADLYGRVAQDGGSVPADQVAATYEAILKQAEEKVSPVFDLKPKNKLTVIAGPLGNYYIAGAWDGSRPGAFYAATEESADKFSMPDVAYHEGIPGHHYQLTVAQELNVPTFRRAMDTNAFIEGWALYAEELMYELGAYDNDPYGNLGRLQLKAMRAARLVVDTGIHAQKWNYNQAVDYMADNVAAGRSEVGRYISAPAQATSYYIGYLKIMELRQKAKDALGARFDLKDFHDVVLGSGTVPLPVLEKLVDEYIAAKKNQ